MSFGSQSCGSALLSGSPVWPPPPPQTHFAPKPPWRGLHRVPAPPPSGTPPRSPRPRPSADVSCYVSSPAAAPADTLLPRRAPRPREVAGASGTAVETRAAHLRGAGAAWPGSRPRAAQGAVWGLFLLFSYRTVGPRAHISLQRPRRPLPGRAAVPARLKGAACQPVRTWSRRRCACRASRGAWAAGGAWGLGARRGAAVAAPPGAGPGAWRSRAPRPPDQPPPAGPNRLPGPPPLRSRPPAQPFFVELKDFEGPPLSHLRLRCWKADPATSVRGSPLPRGKRPSFCSRRAHPAPRSFRCLMGFF